VCGCIGHSSSTPEAWELWDAQAEALKWRPVVLTDLQGKGFVLQKKHFRYLDFWLLFIKKK